METFVVPSPEASSSPITRVNSDGALLYVSLREEDLKKLDVNFSKDDGFRRKETDEVPLAVPGVHDEYRLTVLPAPKAAQVQVLEATGTSRLDKMYEPDFRRLERGLALLASTRQEIAQAIQHVTEGTVLMASARQENGQVFPSVTEGKVPELGVVVVGAGGELVFGSELAYHKAGKGK